MQLTWWTLTRELNGSMLVADRWSFQRKWKYNSSRKCSENRVSCANMQSNVKIFHFIITSYRILLWRMRDGNTMNENRWNSFRSKIHNYFLQSNCDARLPIANTDTRWLANVSGTTEKNSCNSTLRILFTDSHCRNNWCTAQLLIADRWSRNISFTYNWMWISCDLVFLFCFIGRLLRYARMSRHLLFSFDFHRIEMCVQCWVV